MDNRIKLLEEILSFRMQGVEFFFFQAEDGIRDGTVTGVQTCALPIYPRLVHRRRAERVDHHGNGLHHANGIGNLDRSEERRVGKECRSCWASISRWITTSSSWKRFCLVECRALSSIMLICVLTAIGRR